MKILHGFILFLAVKFSSSIAEAIWSKLSPWEPCSKTCGGGHQYRTRSCPVSCIGSSQDARDCNVSPCPVNGDWGQWSTWTLCSVTCGAGTSTTNRLCNNPAPANNGANCQGSSGESQACSAGPCPVNGEWGQWSTWSLCSVTCGAGTSTRGRLCNNPAPGNNGANCQGSSSGSQACSAGLCPVNGDWGQWSTWTLCSVTCGAGTSTRGRLCNNPAPANNGANCQGSSSESQACSAGPCPVNGQWGTWGSWLCSVTCGQGTKAKYRSCNNPAPAYGGDDCPGGGNETASCSRTPCSDFANSSMSVGAVIAGIVSACVVLLTVVVAVFFILRRRRQKNTEKHNDYEVSDIKQGEDHVYIQTSTSGGYCNTDLRSSAQMKIKEDILIEYNSSELSKFFLDEQLCAKKVKEEFQWLTKSKPREHVTDYENVNVPSENEMDTSYDTYVKTAILKTDGKAFVPIMIEMPNKFNLDVFWKMVNDFKACDIILMVQNGEQVTDICPTADEPLEMPSLKIKMIGVEKKENDIILYSFELTDKGKQTVQPIRLYKTTNWKSTDRFPDISTLRKLITTPQVTSARAILMGSKGYGFLTCGILSVCLEVVQTIKDSQKFSIPQFAMELMKKHSECFQIFEEYEMCYKVMKHFIIENEHHYYSIE